MPRTSTSAIASRSIAIKLRSTRELAGLTQAALAARSNNNQSYIAKLEAGDANPTLGQLHALANALGAALQVEFILPDRPTIVLSDTRGEVAEPDKRSEPTERAAAG